MKGIRNTIIILLVIGLLIGIKLLFFPAKKASVKGKSLSATSATPVTVHVAKKTTGGDIIYSSGTVLANEEADLHPETSGRIEYLHMPEGKKVSKGTLLLKVNDNDIRAQLKKVSSQIRLAEATTGRQRKLLEIEGASVQEYEQAQANLSALKADSAYYMAQIKKTEVRAPFSGILGIRQVSMGSYVTPATIIATISQIDPVKIDFFLPEKYSGLLITGSRIKCRVEGSARIYKAVISVKDPKIDVANRSVRFRAVAANSDGSLMPGSFVKIELVLKGKQETVYVPTEAVVATITGKKVFVIKNGKAEEREVQSGLRTAESVQILSGLEAGDSVVVTGSSLVKQGARVSIQQKNLNQDRK